MPPEVMERSSRFPDIIHMSKTVGLKDEELSADFLNVSARNKVGNVRTYTFRSCHGNLPASGFVIDKQEIAPSVRDVDNMAAYSLNEILPIRVMRYLKKVDNKDTYHVTYSVRERFPHSEFVYDKYGANWKMSNILDYLRLSHTVGDPVWEIGVADGVMSSLILHYVLSQLLNIARMALAAQEVLEAETSESQRKTRTDNNISKSLVTSLTITRSFLPYYIQRVVTEDREASIKLVCGRASSTERYLEAVFRDGTLRAQGNVPLEWQVLADLVPQVFMSSGQRYIQPIFTEATKGCLDLVDKQAEFSFMDVQDVHDRIVLARSVEMRNMVKDPMRVQNLIDDLDDIPLEGFKMPADIDWREAEESHLATQGNWSSIGSRRRIGGVKVRPGSGMLVSDRGPSRFKLFNQDKSLAMTVEYGPDGLRVIRRGTIKDVVKRFVPFTEFNSPVFGAKFKDNFVSVSQGDPTAIANAIFSGCYGARAAVWLLGKLAFAGKSADKKSPSVVAGKQAGGTAVRSLLGDNVGRNMTFLTDGKNVYMYYPGTYKLKRLVNKGGYYECQNTNIMDTSGMKTCKLDSVKQIA